MKKFLLVLLAGTLLFSCKKKEEPEFDFGYNYFPVTGGTYRHYLVDSIGHDITSDTSAYQIKEVLSLSYIDDTGHPAVNVMRYKRYQNGQPWVLQSVWVQQRKPTTAERVENNERFVRMVFPIQEDKIWDGNAFNTQDPWFYSYSNIGGMYEVGPFDFENTVVVNQRNNVNLIDQEIAYEVYAENIGMIFKRLVDLNVQEDGIRGIELEMRLIDFGQEQ